MLLTYRAPTSLYRRRPRSITSRKVPTPISPRYSSCISYRPLESLSAFSCPVMIGLADANSFGNVCNRSRTCILPCLKGLEVADAARVLIFIWKALARLCLHSSPRLLNTLTFCEAPVVPFAADHLPLQTSATAVFQLFSHSPDQRFDRLRV
ncbi:hypothetical protein BC629DRAFT_3875 [Irpex lacteus]|nr:hypothetical protein BC629DRAFT_3875 [Irpex lacteus]